MNKKNIILIVAFFTIIFLNNGFEIKANELISANNKTYYSGISNEENYSISFDKKGNTIVNFNETPQINPLFGQRVLIESNKTFNTGQHPAFKGVYRLCSSYSFSASNRLGVSVGYSKGPLSVSISNSGSTNLWTVKVPQYNRKSIPIMNVKGDIYREDGNSRDTYRFTLKSEWATFIYE